MIIDPDIPDSLVFRKRAINWYRKHGPCLDDCYGCPAWDRFRLRCHVCNRIQSFLRNSHCSEHDWIKFVVENV